MKIPGFIRRDFGRKLVALLFAVVVYYSIGYQQRETRWIRNVPVEVQPAGSEFIMSPGSSSFRTDIQVRGNAERLDAAVPEMFAGAAEAGEENRRGGGVYAVTLVPGNFHTPRGIEVVKVAADKAVLEVRMQRRISRELPVKPRVAGHLSEDFRLGEMVVMPRRVVVTGPETDVNRLKEVLTERVPLSPEIEESILYRAKVEAPSSVTVVPDRVEVQIGVERNIGEVVWQDIPVGLLCDRNAGLGVSFVEENPRVSVTVRSSAASQAGRVMPENLRAFVDVTRLSSPGIHKVNVECHIRGGRGTVRAIHPGEFSVKIVKTNRK